MLTLEKVRATFFFFGSLFLFALAIEQKEKVNKNFSFLQIFLIIFLIISLDSKNHIIIP